MGYSPRQMKELEETINSMPVDSAVLGTPTDLSRYLKINKPAVHVKYELQEIGKPNLEDVVTSFLKEKGVI